MVPQESKKTLKAREKIIQLYKNLGFQVTEEELFPCSNNMGEVDISLKYQADLVLRKIFILELDPEFHGSKVHRNKDKWRDENIEREYNIKTVRLDPADIIKQDSIDIMLEVDSQLQSKS